MQKNGYEDKWICFPPPPPPFSVLPETKIKEKTGKVFQDTIK